LPPGRELKIRTHRGKVHEAGEGHDPEVHGVDHVTTVELEEESASDTWTSERRIKQRTDQETVG